MNDSQPTGLRRLLGEHLPYRMLEDSAIPMHVVATDLLTGATVCLSSGTAVDAVLASCAIPAIYPPVRIADRLLIDAGVASTTPIRAAVELGATRLIVLPTRFACRGCGHWQARAVRREPAFVLDLTPDPVRRGATSRAPKRSAARQPPPHLRVRCELGQETGHALQAVGCPAGTAAGRLHTLIVGGL
jgi:predicted acylesterase/phospholipase RssA